MEYAKYSEKKSFPWLVIITAGLVVTAVVIAIIALSAGSGSKDKKKAKGTESESGISSADTSSEETDKLVMEEHDSWRLMLVNSTNPTPNGYAPPEITKVSGGEIDSRISQQFNEMIKASKQDGVDLALASSYRTYTLQSGLYNAEVNSHKAMGKDQATAEADAAKEVARPGTSEHVTGLALDIVYGNYYKTHKQLETDFDESKEFKWLQENAHNHGFIMRYPKDKTDITGVMYEPWHYRFVGLKNAQYMKENNLTLEEYLELFE